MSHKLDVAGDGGLSSTIEDLAWWHGNFYSGEVGGAQFLTTMLTTGRLNSGRALSYAFGLVVDEFRGLNRVGHSRGWQGYTTNLVRFPDEQLSVACLCNTRTADASRLSLQIAELYRGDKMTASSTAAAPARASFPNFDMKGYDITEYSGEYHSDELPATFRFEMEGNSVRLVGKTQNDPVLQPLRADAFLMSPGMELIFTRDAKKRLTDSPEPSGAATGLRHRPPA